MASGKKTAVIIFSILGGLFFIGLITLIIIVIVAFNIFKINNNTDAELSNSYNDYNSYDDDDFFNSINNTTNNTTTNNNTIGNDADNTINTPEVDNTITAIESSLTDLLNKNEWGYASKYNTQVSGYQDVRIRITKYTRGLEAKQIAKDYLDNSSVYEYDDPDEGAEWLVIDYEVDFYNFERSKYGDSTTVSVDISGLDGKSGIKYNGSTFYTTAMNIGSSEYVKTTKGTGRVLTQMLEGCTDYAVVFGVSGEGKAYFTGE